MHRYSAGLADTGSQPSPHRLGHATVGAGMRVRYFAVVDFVEAEVILDFVSTTPSDFLPRRSPRRRSTRRRWRRPWHTCPLPSRS